ncbi:hypothetical protein ColLi_09975 [Colletotrichum liriopes]|uniref:Uncharacterized protein n=1 Tax=Colletotrichum liriopes TaxID=708192 RepID=A0AA37GVA6_9PEZI|nr:hypothetical protein ColLi_09975 [Colletotrichum liriopes]
MTSPPSRAGLSRCPAAWLRLTSDLNFERSLDIWATTGQGRCNCSKLLRDLSSDADWLQAVGTGLTQRWIVASLFLSFHSSLEGRANGPGRKWP